MKVDFRRVQSVYFGQTLINTKYYLLNRSNTIVDFTINNTLSTGRGKEYHILSAEDQGPTRYWEERRLDNLTKGRYIFAPVVRSHVYMF